MVCMEVCRCSNFYGCEYSWDPWVTFVATDEFSVEVAKISSEIHSPIDQSF